MNTAIKYLSTVLFAFVAVLLMAAPSFATDLYWVGGDGTYDGVTNHFATTSGGTPTVAAPTSSDDVVWDSLSNATGYTVTVSATLTCRDFTMGAPASGVVTWAGASQITCYRSMSLAGTSAITRTYTGNFVMVATSGTNTVTSNGVSLHKIQFDGVGGTFQLIDTLIQNSNGGSIVLTTGAIFDPNGQLVNITTAGSASIAGAFTFYDLTRTGSAATTNTLALTQPITVTHNLTLTGNNPGANRLLVSSNTVGTARTITAANVTASNVDFQDVTAAGAGNWDLSAGAAIGLCGGTTGITGTPAANQHWLSIVGGNWSSAANWTSRVPLPQDSVVMDCAFGTSKTVTADMPRLGGSIDWTGATWTTSCTWAMSTSSNIFGGLKLIPGLTMSSINTYTFAGRGAYTLDTQGLSIDRGLTLNAPGGTLTLAGDLTMLAARTFTVTNGTLSNGGGALVFSTGGLVVANGCTLTLGSATHLMTGVVNAGTIFSIGPTTTITANTATIKFTDTSGTALIFGGGGKTYGGAWFARGASTAINTVSGSNTFAQFKDDGSGIHTDKFTAGTTNTSALWTFGNTTNVITLDSTTTATYGLTKTGSGKISCDYLNIQHAVATPGHTWFAGANSTDNQATATAGSGWIFTTVPTPQVNTINGILRTLVNKQNNLDEYQIDLRNAI